MAKKKELVHAKGSNKFFLHGGDELSNLHDLHDALLSMRDDQFAHHVGGTKNDFALWVSEVLDDAVCAKALGRVKRRKTMAAKVADCLKGYKK